MQDDTSQMPISVAALGEVHHDGSSNDLDSRLRRKENTWVIDETHYYTHVEFLGRRIAARGPGYLQGAPTSSLSSPGVLFQVNEVLPKQSQTALHALLDTQKEKSHFITDLEFDWPETNTNLSATLSPLERAILSNEDPFKIQTELEKIGEVFGIHPRYTYLRGIEAFRKKNFAESKEYFHASMLLGHVDGYDAELLATQHRAKPFREKFPHIFSSIQSGEQLRILTQLRAIQHDHPLEASAALAYCLRKSHEWEEGVEVCARSLSIDPCQSDVYGHYWSYLTHLGRDEDALQVALTHLGHYPMNPQAYTDALDSCLLLGDLTLAKWYVFGYLIHARNLNTALKNLFKYFELGRDWTTLRQFFEVIMPLLRSPTPQTLVYYGETLLELGENSKAMQPLDRALMAAPEEIDVVLANGRALAKLGKVNSAIKLMRTVLADRNRQDLSSDQFLIITLLSELYRNNDQLGDALALWPDITDMNEHLLSAVGPRPFVEYAYCLAEQDDLEGAFIIANRLNESFSELYMVKRLRQDLDGTLS